MCGNEGATEVLPKRAESESEGARAEIRKALLRKAAKRKALQRKGGPCNVRRVRALWGGSSGIAVTKDVHGNTARSAPAPAGRGPGPLVPAVAGKRCSLCESTDLFVFAERARVPVHQNIPADSARAARDVTRGDLQLACCRSCGFITNLEFDDRLVTYEPGYENDQTHSPVFEAHTTALIASLVDAGCKDTFVLEIGAGQGQFLRQLCIEGSNRGQGFDPAYIGPQAIDAGRVTFVREPYRGQAPAETPHLVLCRHVLEHVPDPMALLRDIRDGVCRQRAVRIAFELRTVDWVLEKMMVQDFFYEHCSYFTQDSLRFAFERAGFTNVVTRATFAGQYLWATAEYNPAAPRRSQPRRDASALVRAVERYQKYAESNGAALQAKLEQLRAAGPVAIWGAGAKGVTYLNMVDPEADVVDCTVDVNPKKQGKFVVGTGHPIVSPEQMVARGVRGVLVMNPVYLDEVRQIMRALGPNVVVVA